MFIHNINPYILSIGNIHFRYYGLVYAIGFIIVYLVLLNSAKKEKIKNLTEPIVDKFIIYIIFSIIIGGRLGEVIFYNLPYYLANPLRILMIWQGGMSFHGALIAIVIVSYLFCKKYKIDFLELADVISIPAAFVLFLGRIANFINAELIGKISNAWYCIDYSNYGIQGCRHPSQLYEAAKNLVIGLFLMFEYNFLNKKKTSHNKNKGAVFFSFISLYGLLRFFINFYRDDPIIFLGLITGQIFSFAMLLIGLILLLHLRISSSKKE